LKSGAPDKEISILLPAYNEAVQIEKCVLEVEAAVRSFSKSYEIIVSEDGSTDGTDAIVAKMAKHNSHLILLLVWAKAKPLKTRSAPPKAKSSLSWT
jgi:glycosyltransferase involved in cell wall biosynthesis